MMAVFWVVVPSSLEEVTDVSEVDRLRGKPRSLADGRKTVEAEQ
jgi:hypothetical protein